MQYARTSGVGVTTAGPPARRAIRMTRDTHGTPEFRRTNLALFSAGFATFALLYCVQPLMPVFAREFHVSAAQSSLSLSLTTGLLAPAMIVAGAISEIARTESGSWSRRSVASSRADDRLRRSRGDGSACSRSARSPASRSPDCPRSRWRISAEEVHPASIGLAMGLGDRRQRARRNDRTPRDVRHHRRLLVALGDGRDRRCSASWRR